jgi:hypothetical protein
MGSAVSLVGYSFPVIDGSDVWNTVGECIANGCGYGALDRRSTKIRHAEAQGHKTAGVMIPGSFLLASLTG